MVRSTTSSEQAELLPDTKEHQIYFKFIFFGLFKFTTSEVRLFFPVAHSHRWIGESNPKWFDPSRYAVLIRVELEASTGGAEI